jgi:AraC-like DNA-binding protein
LKKRDKSGIFQRTVREQTQLRAAGPGRGGLSSLAADGWFDPRRILPSLELSPFVHHFWSLRWALRTPYLGEVLPHPTVSLLVESRAGVQHAEIRGVHTGRFSRRLEGEGQVFGIAFRPAMFQPILGASMASLTDRIVPVEQVLGAKTDARVRAIHAAVGRVASRCAAALERELELQTMVHSAEALLGELLPRTALEVTRWRDLVERMAGERSLLSVEAASQAAGLNVRSLQRSFRRYVGATPKWVIQRYRLLEATEQLKGSSQPDLAALAASLGYADQAHFTRDFTVMVGQTPGSFARNARAQAR